jgi:hypothetical protein
MGVGLGLGALSSVAPAEMQGALALGGMAAQINPLLGLGVAGLGGAFMAQSAGTGALAGMGGGAAVGAMVGGPVGAIIGAALGGVAGAIRGWRNKSKAQGEEARKSVQEALNASTAGIVSNVAKNLAEQGGRLGAMPIKQGLAQVGSNATQSISAMERQMARLSDGTFGIFATQASAGREARSQKEVARDVLDVFNNVRAGRGEVSTAEQLKTQRTNPIEAAEEAYTKLMAQEEASIFMTGMFTKRMSELTNITGMSESQVLALAKSLGVDLMDPMKGTIELTKELGHLQLRTAEQITQAYATLAGDVQTVFSQAIDALNAPDVVNEATRTISDLIDSGSAKDTDILAYLENVVGQTVSYYGDNTAGAITQLLTSFGTEDTMGTAFTDPNSPLYGRQAAFETAEVGAALSKTTDMMIDRMSSELLRDTNANLSDSSGQVIENGAAFMAQIGNIARSNPALLSTFQEAAGNNFEAFGGDAAEFFRNQGIDIQSLGVTEAASAAPSQEGLDDAVKDEITELSKQFGSIFEKYSDKPEWMTDKFIRKIAEESGGDTSTPRGSGIGDTTSSRLATTMNRHSVMDSMLTGKRNITSAWRNTNLGSMNSDHVTGRAYDLTGQNLGQYQSLVNGTGGFAEFHGVNGARHLHVVPGPVGDTAVPSMSSSTPARSTSSSGVTNNYSVNVSTNASDPEAVATFVMQKIEQVNRDSRERR